MVYSVVARHGHDGTVVGTPTAMFIPLGQYNPLQV